MKRGNFIVFLALHLMLVVYSLSGVLSKLASRFDFLSMQFIACYGGIIALLGLYAIVWQQIIKRIPLTTAYANRAITVVWGMVWGVLIFSESLSILQVVGGAIVLTGVVLYALSESHGDDEKPEASKAAKPTGLSAHSCKEPNK